MPKLKHLPFLYIKHVGRFLDLVDEYMDGNEDLKNRFILNWYFCSDTDIQARSSALANRVALLQHLFLEPQYWNCEVDWWWRVLDPLSWIADMDAWKSTQFRSEYNKHYRPDKDKDAIQRMLAKLIGRLIQHDYDYGAKLFPTVSEIKIGELTVHEDVFHPLTSKMTLILGNQLTVCPGVMSTAQKIASELYFV